MRKTKKETINNPKNMQRQTQKRNRNTKEEKHKTQESV